jgi:DNA invertase Pin-like site-specific DNA recombinase
MKKQLFAYCRVSTEQQRENKNVQIQEDKINKWQKYREEEFVIKEWFIDDGISAFKDRPKFDEMMSRLNECDGIVITRLDRIGRSVKQLAEIVDELDSAKKLFIVITQNIDTSTKEGRLLLHMLSAIAEFEAELIHERMMDGRERHINNGGKIGRNEIDLETQKVYIKRMYEVNKLGCGRIAKLLFNEHQIDVSNVTLLKRLKDWNINIRTKNNKNLSSVAT